MPKPKQRQNTDTTQGSGLLIKSLTLRNIVGFQHARLDVPSGITIIRGRNLNARSSNQSNAVGKSVLVSSIANLLMRGPPISSKRNDKKALLASGSSIELEVDKDGHNYKVTQQSKGSSVAYQVLKDGQDLKLRTVPIAEQWISDFHGLNETEFYTLFYLDGRREFSFQMGSDATRLAFFTSLFRLETYDQIRQHLLEHRATLKERAPILETAQADLVRVDKSLKDTSWSPKTKSRYLDLIEQRATLLRRSSGLSTEVTTLLQARELLQRRDTLVSSIKQLTKESHGETLESLLAERNLVHDYKTYVAQRENWSKRKAKLEHKLAQLPPADDSFDVHSAEKHITKIEKKLERLESNYHKLKSLKNETQQRLEHLREEYKRLPDVKPSPSSKEELQRQQAELSLVVRLSKLLKKSDRKCPTCGSPLDSASILSRAQKAKSTLESIDRKIEAIELVARKEALVAEGTKLSSVLKSDELALVESQQKEIDSLRKQRKSISKLMTTLSERESLEAQLSELVEPKPMPKPKRSIEQIDNLVDKARQLKSKLKQLESLKDEISQLHSTVVTKASKSDVVAKVQEEHKEVTTRMHDLAVEINKLRSAYTAYASLRKQKKGLEARINKLEKALKDLPIIDALIECYSNKGLKVLALQNMASIVQQNMNQLANLIFVEPTKFRFVVDAGKFSVSFVRRKVEADVRRLSGAESRNFALLFMASILPLVPARLRTNLVILDEMDANMSDASKLLFAQDFLPYLNTVVPSVINVTPDNTTPYPGRVLTVVKKGQVSTLENGSIGGAVNKQKGHLR